MVPNAKINDGNSKTRIRMLAIFFSAAIILPINVARISQPTSEMAHAWTLATACALSGLAAWFAYHLVSRENNGLGVLVLGLYDPVRPTESFGSALAFLLSIHLTIGLIIGLSARAIRTRKSRPKVADREPMYDPQIDPVA